jgi:hypothetical protein
MVRIHPAPPFFLPPTGQFKGKWTAGNLDFYFYDAGVAQLVEHQPSKLGVESSSLFARSILQK